MAVKRILAFLLLAATVYAAEFGDIPANLTLGPCQAVRRNSANSLYEAYNACTPTPTPSATATPTATPIASTTPGGSDTQVQYNNSGTFGGIPSFTYDGTIPATITLNNMVDDTDVRDGILLQNTTAATAPTPSQVSPTLHWLTHTWNGSGSVPIEFKTYVGGFGAGTSDGDWVLASRVNNGAWNYALDFDANNLVLGPTLFIYGRLQVSTGVRIESFTTNGFVVATSSNGTLAVATPTATPTPTATATSTPTPTPTASVSHIETLVVNGGGIVLGTGAKAPDKLLHVSGTLKKWSMVCTPSGSVTADILRAANGAGLPVTSIVGGGTKPFISSGVENTGTNFASWTSIVLSDGDNITVSLSGITDVTYVQLKLWFDE